MAVSAVYADGTRVELGSSRFDVIPEAFTTVEGSVVDEAGKPVAGARVELYAAGMNGSFFHVEAESGAAAGGKPPDAQKLVSAPMLRNPGSVFGEDPWGALLQRPYRVRLEGLFVVDQDGEFKFDLRTNHPGRVMVDGQVVADAPSSPMGTVRLRRGLVPVTVEAGGSGDGDLRLTISETASGRRVSPDRAFLSTSPRLAATTGGDGTFKITAVPAYLSNVRVVAYSQDGGNAATGASEAVRPVPDGVTRVGATKISNSRGARR